MLHFVMHEVFLPLILMKFQMKKNMIRMNQNPLCSQLSIIWALINQGLLSISFGLLFFQAAYNTLHALFSKSYVFFLFIKVKFHINFFIIIPYNF